MIESQDNATENNRKLIVLTQSPLYNLSRQVEYSNRTISVESLLNTVNAY